MSLPRSHSSGADQSLLRECKYHQIRAYFGGSLFHPIIIGRTDVLHDPSPQMTLLSCRMMRQRLAHVGQCLRSVKHATIRRHGRRRTGKKKEGEREDDAGCAICALRGCEAFRLLFQICAGRVAKMQQLSDVRHGLLSAGCRWPRFEQSMATSLHD